MKRASPLILAVVLALSLTCPALATEPAESATPDQLYPVEVVESGEGDSRRLEKIYHLTPNQDPANIATGDFDREGYHYTLLDVTRKDLSEAETKDYMETVTVESKSKSMDKIMPLLPATMETATEDGFTGVLTLDTASIKVEAAGYGSSSRTVTATRSFPNLSDADTALIPKTTEDNGRTLTLAGVEWQEAGGYYHATATYTGTATSSYATGYTVTANYAGEVTKTSDGVVVYTATFSGVPINTPIVPDPGIISPVEEGGLNGLLFLLPLAACVGGLGFGGYRLMKKYKAKKEWEDYTKCEEK